MRRAPAGYEPAPDRSTNQFAAVGGDMSGVIGDLSFPAQPGTELVPRGGPVCRHCYLPPSDHQSPSSQAGYEPLASIPGVHPDTDTALNSADSRYSEFHNSAAR